jgi:hypothetical protein
MGLGRSLSLAYGAKVSDFRSVFLSLRLLPRLLLRLSPHPSLFYRCTVAALGLKLADHFIAGNSTSR